MPLFMDTHSHIEGLTADAVAQAHAADLKTQEKYGVKYLRYCLTRMPARCSVSLKRQIKKRRLPFIAKPMACLPMKLLRSKRERRRLGVTDQGQAEETRLSPDLL